MHNNLGLLAENLITSLLRIYGLSILARNVRLPFTELDIVASYKQILYIVEVRSRRYTPESSDYMINRKKLIKIKAGGELYFRYIKSTYKLNTIKFYLAFVIWYPHINVEFVRFSDLI